MPRAGYDLTGAAPGSPAAEAVARGRSRRAAANLTPRARSPDTRDHPEEEDQTTPRASRIGVTAGACSSQASNKPQANWAAQVPQAGRFPWGATAPEPIQNPLNPNSFPVVSSMAGTQFNALYMQGVAPEAPMSTFAVDGATAFGPATQLPQPRSSLGYNHLAPSQGCGLGNWSGNQPRVHSRDSIYPNPEDFSHVRTSVAEAAPSHSATTNINSSVSGNADDDVEMTDSEDN